MKKTVLPGLGLFFFTIIYFEYVYTANPAISDPDQFLVEPVNVDKFITAPKLRGAILQKLKEIFAYQFPQNAFKRREYTIINWPASVNQYDPHSWTKDELFMINAKIPFFRFVPIETKVESCCDSIKRLRASLMKYECLTNAVLNEEMSRRVTFKFILERFRKETGNADAKSIEWPLLDSSWVKVVLE